MKGVVRALLKTLCVFSVLLWVYEVGVSWFAPQWLASPLTHYDVFPFNIRNDTLGILAFAIAAASFLFLQIIRNGERA